MGIIAAVLVMIVSFIFFSNNKIFYFLVGIGFVIGGFPFIISLMLEGGREKENNEMFLEFSRNLVESVKAGTPVSRGIVMLQDKYYGSLTPHIKKLANQISIGISVKDAFRIFSRDVNSKIINRAITLISEAEKAGGEIENILESVAKSVNEVEELKKERQNSMYSLIIQGYIIFFIFIVIILIMQFKIFPLTSDIGNLSPSLGDYETFEPVPFEDVSKPMLYLLITQGLFTGLIIGKLAEGNFKSGIKHSFMMVTMSILIYTGARAFL